MLTALAGVQLDRAAVALLRGLADAEPLRLGELAQLLAVEASHVTRQVRQLERSGHVERVPDPDDGRALRVRLTPVGDVVVVSGTGGWGQRFVRRLGSGRIVVLAEATLAWSRRGLRLRWSAERWKIAGRPDVVRA
ncbi:MarR family transcriptional regulator [Streptomyces sp. NBC_00444]|uniref:MarR family transcriptional regulator n=1 Tax=unclassified Streptomyces TaxID=2593676 RepID=UPI003FA69042